MFDWLENISDWLVYGVFGLEEASKLGLSLSFFIYDTIKILILLFVIVIIMGIVNEYFPIEKLRNYLARKKMYGLEYFSAAIFGSITPFCSCSSVPLFIGFVQGGIPLGVTLAFLITSPLVNTVAVALFISMFGMKATIIYAVSGILLGTIGGWFLGKLKLETLLTPWVQEIIEKRTTIQDEFEEENLTFVQRLPSIFRGAWEIVRGVLLYIIIGIGIGAAMYGYVPEDFFEKYLGGGEWWTVPLAVGAAVPMYANAAAIVPIVGVFVAKGVPLGTAIAFMMGTIGLSIPAGTLLKKVMTWKLIAIYFGVVTVFIILSGYVFNILL
ncbi:MAG: permease [Crocinitomicaceae bacterium]|nr:permease [Crocinitomicaceae bacterium]